MLPDLDPSMVSRSEQLLMFQSGKALVAALKSAAGNEAVSDDFARWVVPSLPPPFFVFFEVNTS